MLRRLTSQAYIISVNFNLKKTVDWFPNVVEMIQ